MEASTQWNEERPLWRVVVLWNLLSAVNRVAQALQDAIRDPDETVSHVPTSFRPTSTPDALAGGAFRKVSHISTTSSVPSSRQFFGAHHTLSIMLEPLKMVTADLEEVLHGSRRSKTECAKVGVVFEFRDMLVQQSKRLRQEFCVRSQEQWMINVRADEGSVKDSNGNPIVGKLSKFVLVRNVVLQLRAEIKRLWDDPTVRGVLRGRKVKLDSSAE